MLTKQVLYFLNHTSSPFCFGYFLKMGSHKLFAWAGLEQQSSQSQSFSSQVYRCEPPAPGFSFFFFYFIKLCTLCLTKLILVESSIIISDLLLNSHFLRWPGVRSWRRRMGQISRNATTTLRIMKSRYHNSFLVEIAQPCDETWTTDTGWPDSDSLKL
jgi:hypothetical protein